MIADTVTIDIVICVPPIKVSTPPNDYTYTGVSNVNPYRRNQEENQMRVRYYDPGTSSPVTPDIYVLVVQVTKDQVGQWTITFTYEQEISNSNSNTLIFTISDSREITINNF